LCFCFYDLFRYHDAIHPLLYTHIKGKTENDVIGLEFEKTSIFRPGMLDRAGSDRWIEKLFAYLPNTHVSDLAKAMILDAQSANKSANEQKEPLILETGALQNLAQQY
jgi:oxidoreductase